MFQFLKKLFAARPSAPETAPHRGAAPAPVAPPHAPPTQNPPGAPPTPEREGESLRFSLRAIVGGLPSTLKPLVLQTPPANAELVLPEDRVLQQLSKGKVRVSVGELRQAAPQFFAASNAQDALEVDIPLAEVLARIPSGRLARKQQRTIEIPSDVTPLFGERGEPIVPGTVAPPQPAPSRAEIPPAQAPLRMPSAPPAPALEPAPSAAATEPSEPIEQVQQRYPEAVLLPLHSVIEEWPEELQQRFTQPIQGYIAFPLSELEQALKKGQGQFAWRQLQSWIVPAAAARQLKWPEEVQLPVSLKLLVPAFMMRRQRLTGASAKPAFAIPDSIPPLFDRTGPSFGTAPAEAPAEPKAAPSERLGPSVTTPSVTPPPQKRNAQTIVSEIARVPGAAGAILATSDGLVVSAVLPPGWSAEALAAFAPGIYGRICQFTRAVPLPEPKHVRVVIDGAALSFFAVGKDHLIVQSGAESVLPQEQIANLAAELARQSQSS